MMVPATRTCSLCKITQPLVEFVSLKRSEALRCSSCRARQRLADAKRSARSSRGDVAPPARESAVQIRVAVRAEEKRRLSLVAEASRGLERREEHREVEDHGVERPRTRGDCIDGPRPCPWAGCRHHTFLDVLPSGSIQFNWPDRELEDMDPEHSCSLDIASRGGGTLEEVSSLANVTRERIRQIEAGAMAKVRRRSQLPGSGVAKELLGFCERPDFASASPHAALGSARGSWASAQSKADAERESVEEDSTASEENLRISFFDTTPDADRQVADSVWNMFVKSSNARGFDARSRASRAATKALTMSRTQAESADPKGTVR